MRARGVARTGLLLAAALGVSACQGLPGSSPVQQGQVVGHGPVEGVRVIPRGPVPGAQPQDLVRDFLRAGVGADDDSGVAREYLTDAGSSHWRPDGSAWVYDDPATLRLESPNPGTVTVTGRVSARLDKEGHYVELAPGQTRSLTVTLVRQGGQWRIDGGLDGLTSTWISRSDLALYASYPVAYAGLEDDSLVTDRRWLLQGPGLLTRLTRAQLAVPPTYLQGAVQTGVPEYTDLAVGAVPVERGVARVPLTPRALNADHEDRRLMWQQLTTTLTAVPGVEAVQLESDGSTLGAPGVPDRPMGEPDLTLDEPDPPTGPVLLRRRGALERADPGQLSERPGHRADSTPVSGPPLPRVGPQWYQLALSVDGAEVAGISGDHRDLAVWRAGRLTRVADVGRELTRPAYDARGSLWLAGRTPSGTRLLVRHGDKDPGGRPVAINVPWLSDRRVLVVRPAADAQRVVVVSRPRDGGPTTAAVAGVLRKDGRPVGLASPIMVAGAQTDVLDVTWLDGETLGVLSAQEQGSPRVVVAPISGPSQLLGTVPRGRSITTYGGTRSIVVVTRDDRAMVRSGNGFAPLVATSDFVVPGH